MNGAERLLETLVEGGVELCFANPGTSEMQLVSALVAAANHAWEESTQPAPALSIGESGAVPGAAPNSFNP
jgi:hypothetical protein